MDWVRMSLIAGLISGICWLTGDIFIVGFDIEEEKYRDFLQNTRIKNKRMAVLMLSGSVRRLRFGALIANFSVPFMLFSVFALYSLAKPSPWAAVAAVLLGVGFSLSRMSLTIMWERCARAFWRITGRESPQAMRTERW